MPSQKNSQYNLFEENPDQQPSNNDHPIEASSMLKELQISKEDNKKESKLKQLISSRVKNIEKLKSLLEKDRKSLNRIKTLYNEKMQSEIDELCKEIARFTEQLIKRYGQKSFSMSQRETLEYLIENNFHDLMIKGYSNEKMTPLVLKYEELKKELYDFDDDLEDEMDDEYEDEFEDEFNEDVDGDDDEESDEEFEKAFTESMIKHILEQMGLEFDEEFFEGLDFNAPDFQTKFQERLFEYKQRQKESEEKETKKQKTLFTDKEFTKLYKSLVKKVHPDLTTDETERLRREELMKKLSSVWQNRDYYELLLLQSQIVDDSDVNITLNKNQLKQIADDLLEKKRELEQERYRHKRHPDNEFYFNFYARTDKKIKKNLENYKQKLKEEKEEVGNNILEVKTQKATKQYLKSVDEELAQDPFNLDIFY